VSVKILFIDFSTQIEDLREMEKTARGGMQNSLFKVPDALSKLNNEVDVLSDIKRGGMTEAETRWFTVDDFENGSYDVLVTNRGIGKGYFSISAKRRVLWTHDLPHLGFAEDPDILDRFDAAVFMSSYASRVWRKLFPRIRNSFIIPNGVDRSLFYPREKDLNYLIYFSHPIRGLNRLPLIFGGIREKMGPQVWMRAFSAPYKNEGLADDHMDKYRFPDTDLPDGLEVLPPIPILQIAEEVGRAGLMVMPTGYPEICSNVILQSLASGTPIVTTGGLGSVPEWVKHGFNGYLTEFQPCDYVIHSVEIAKLAIAILKDPDTHRVMIENAAKTEGIFTWEEIGSKWNKMLHLLF